MIFGCPFASDAGSGMRVVLLPDAEPEPRELAIATDSAPPESDPEPMPVILPEFARREFLQPSASALREAELIASFYEGVPYSIGRRKHDEYLLRKAERSLR